MRAKEAAEAEVARLKAELAEAHRVIEPFADVADTEDEVGREDPEDDRVLVVQAHGCQLRELSIEDFRRARSFRDRQKTVEKG